MPIDHCANCGSLLTNKFCASCGQKKADRINNRYVRAELWSLIRWFELSVLVQLKQTVFSPGTAALGYVNGQRKKYHHPLKMLLYCLGFYLIILNKTRFLQFNNEAASRVAIIVKKYANWSFSLGAIAIFLVLLIAFIKVKPFNAWEKLVLALYTHCVIIVLNGLNLLVSLLFNNPASNTAFKKASPYYMGALEILIVVWAAWQFFQLSYKKYWYRYLLLATLFFYFKKALIYGYAWLIVEGIKRNIL